MLRGGISVSLLRLSAESLRESAVEQALARKLEERFVFSMGYRPSSGEVRSWSASLPVLAHDLCDAGLQNVEVLVEHRLPLSSKRVDAVLAGVHPTTGRPSYVIVELKQWTHAHPVVDADDLVHIDAYGDRPVLHPLEQVRRYVEFLAQFTRSLEQEPDSLVGAAYLHNGDGRNLSWLRGVPETLQARLFLGSERGAWIEFLQSRLAPTPGRIAADHLLSSRIAPSRQLLSVAAAEIKSREQFVLLDEQQVAYSLVVRRSYS